MAKNRRSLLTNLSERVVSREDSERDRLNKTLAIFACGLMGFGAMLWLVIYKMMGIRFSATVPLVYLALSAASLGVYLWNRNFVAFRFIQVSLFLFVPFIIATAFTVLNLFIGVIVDAMQSEHEAEARADRDAMKSETETVLAEVRELRAEISELKKMLARD